MLTIKDMNKNWLNEVKNYIYDYTVGENDIENWDFLTLEVPNIEEYKSDRNYALAFDVKNMGYADYDEINKAFKKLGHDDLDAQDFSEDIYEICQFDNEAIFHDIEDYLEVPFYAMGRMGGHWGVLCKDVYNEGLIDIELDENELWRIIQVEYDDYLRESDDIWDIDCDDIANYAVNEYPKSFKFVVNKDFVKHLNDAWDEIKKQSDYMLTYDYAEYIAERLIEDNFLESKKSARKSIKESENYVNYIAVYDEDSNCCGYIQNEDGGITQTISYALYFKNENEANTLRSKLIKRKIYDGDELYIEGRYINESKKSARKSLKESDDNWYKLKVLNEILDLMKKDEYNIPKLTIYGKTKWIDLDEGAIETLIKYYK